MVPDTEGDTLKTLFVATYGCQMNERGYTVKISSHAGSSEHRHADD